jgi:hypothetical protein
MQLLIIYRYYIITGRARCWWFQQRSDSNNYTAEKEAQKDNRNKNSSRKNTMGKLVSKLHNKQKINKIKTDGSNNKKRVIRKLIK